MTDNANTTLDDLMDTDSRADTIQLSQVDAAERPAELGAVGEAGDDDSLVDETDYVDKPRRRNRLTTTLIVILIFLLGVLVGTQAGSLAAHSSSSTASSAAASSSTGAGG